MNRPARNRVPTNSIQFGELPSFRTRCQRVEQSARPGWIMAYLYGVPGSPGATGDLGHLHAFFLLTDRPEAYNLPTHPPCGARRVLPELDGRACHSRLIDGGAFGFSRFTRSEAETWMS